MGVLRPVREVLTWFFLIGSAVAAIPGLSAAQFLCSAGSRDGFVCDGDIDCPGGSCVIPLGVCESGIDEGGFCPCPGAECTATPVCADDGGLGSCNAGVFTDLCCDLAHNCDDNSDCISTQKLCIGGEYRGFPCLRDNDCPGSHCRSTGGYCFDGDYDSFSCVGDDDCPGGECVFPLPTPTPQPKASCAGDCNDDALVTVDELLTGVSIILLQAQVGACPNFDVDGSGGITIDELIQGVQSILQGCGSSPVSPLRAEDE